MSGLAGGSLQRSPDPLTGLRSGPRGKREREREERDGWCMGRNGEGKVGRRRRVGERMEEGKGGEERGTEGWGGKVVRDCAVLKKPWS